MSTTPPRDPAFAGSLITRLEEQVASLERIIVARDEELMQIQGPCRAPGCMLHRAHNGPCNIGSLARDGS